ncbi:MAG: GNAT family N-acetyltransferase [Rhodobiaceae bacterium]|nr:GNAT family N-acetyltransferase [Rhodobiaceae bacterium]
MTYQSNDKGIVTGSGLPGGGLGARSLYTPRLSLRWIATSDAEQLSVFAGDPLLRQKTETIPHPYDVPAAHEWIDEAQNLRERGQAYRFAIEERSDQQFVGVSALMMLEQGVAELGYWLGRDFWGQGFGREAVAATVAFGEDMLKLRSIQAVVYSENTASVSVLRGLGFEEHAFETINVPDRGGARLVRRFVADLPKNSEASIVVPISGRVA